MGTEWRVAKRPYGRGVSVEVREDRDGRTVCTFPSYDATSDVRRMPNANLCAAAPEMFEALWRLVDPKSGHLRHCAFPQVCTATCAEVLAALNKAQGK